MNVAAENLALLERIVHGRLVGRVPELAQALAQWQRAMAGEGNVLLVSGEPGVGKTRFVRELVTQAEARGAVALLGECYSEGESPYAPISRILRDSYAHPALDTINLPDLVLADLVTLAPALRSRFPNSVPNPRLDREVEQERLFESVVAWCEAVNVRSPLLLFVDDVQWADAGTLFLLRHLARRGRHLRLLIAMTCRDAELLRSSPLDDVLLDLNRARLITHLDLHRLTREETLDLLGSMFADEITPEFLDGIQGQTEGNPFFVEEVCKALVEGGELIYQDGRWHRPSTAGIMIPHTVRSAILQRVLKLPEQAQGALAMAAILGMEFDPQTLKHVCDLDEEALANALESAVRAQLIAQVGSGRAETVAFTFSHVLIPTTLRENVNPVRRQRMHKRAAAAIQALRPDDFEALAYHHAEAGDTERAREYYLRAGDRAQLAAPGDAARFYRAALERWSDADPVGRGEALARLGYCLWVTGDVQGALERFERAYTLFDKFGNHTQSGDMQRMIGRMYWEQANREAATQHFQQALAILDQGPETAELARAMSSISQMHLLAPEEDQAIAWAERALALAERLGAEDVIVDALNNIGSGRAQTGDYEMGLRTLQESLQHALAAGLPAAACRAYYNSGVMLHRQCLYAEANQQMEQLYTYSSQVYHRDFANLALLRLTLDNWLIGRWSAALSYRGRMAEFSAMRQVTWLRRITGSIDLDLGRIEDARRELEEDLPSALRANDLQTTVPHLGQLARAFAALELEAKTVETIQRMLEFVSRTLYLSAESIMPLLFACQWLASQTAENSLETAHICLSQLVRHLQQYHTGEASAALAEGQAYTLLAEGRPRDAAAQFRQSAEHWQTIQRPYDQARVLGGLGRASLAASDSSTARNAHDQALDILNALAAQLPEELKATFLASPLVREIREAAEGLPKPTPREIARQKFGGLTEREREVAALIAGGHSNRAIAEQLVITERTVEKHIENIMSKLGFSARTQIAVWAVEKGLAFTKG